MGNNRKNKKPVYLIYLIKIPQKLTKEILMFLSQNTILSLCINFVSVS